MTTAIRRLLFISLAEKNIPTVPENLNLLCESRPWDNLPTLHDYDVIVVDLHNLNGSDIGTASGYNSRFEEQVKSGGLLIVFAAPNETYSPPYATSHHRYEWIPSNEYLQLVEESGNSLVVLDSEFRPVFDAFSEEDISWELYFKQSSPFPVVRPLATTRGGLPISIQYTLEGGTVVLFPLISNRKRALEVLIGSVLPEFWPDIVEPKEQTEERTPIPSWIHEFAFKKKGELLDKVRSQEAEIQKFAKFEALLYTRGQELVEAVALAMQEIGFETKIMKTGEPIPDLEMKIPGQYNGIAEVKGLNSPLNVENLRQLLHYYVDKRDVEQVRDINPFLLRSRPLIEPATAL